jgi:hypothetical protein
MLKSSLAIVIQGCFEGYLKAVYMLVIQYRQYIRQSAEMEGEKP